jgi:sterol desaturase/sphingolipid hydroxylase (fatty acid hydroxylase superfamily)
MTIFILVGYLVLSVVLMSAFEYSYHRWVMHKRRGVGRAFERHAVLHHHRYVQEFVGTSDPAAKHVGIDSDVPGSLVGLSPLWILMGWWDWRLATVFLGVVIFHGLVWTVLHREMHFPARQWVRRLPGYRYLNDYHQRHHEHPSCNFNAVFPMFDWVFGTLAKELK